MKSRFVGSGWKFTTTPSTVLKAFLKPSPTSRNPPTPTCSTVGTEAYLDHIRKAKSMVAGYPRSSPASTAPPWAVGLTTPVRWSRPEPTPSNSTSTGYPPDMDMSGADVEQAYLDIVRAVRAAVEIPPGGESSAPNFSPTPPTWGGGPNASARRVPNGLVLFNRFYQPDINIEELEVQPNLILAPSRPAPCPFTWILPCLYNNSSAVSRHQLGINRSETSSKCSWPERTSPLLVATLLRHGHRGHIKTLEDELIQWAAGNEYDFPRPACAAALSQRNSPQSKRIRAGSSICAPSSPITDLEW